MKANIIGPRLRQWRLGQTPKVTQEELAARLQLVGMASSRATVSKIEAGLRRVNDMELKVLAQITGQSPSWLMDMDRSSDTASEGEAQG